MRLFCYLINGFILLIANLTGLWIGFLAFSALRLQDQLALQVPVGVVLTVLLFLLWCLLLKYFHLRSLLLESPQDCLWTIAFSLIWNPVIFVLLHYYTQGYLTAAGNVVMLALFQLPTNGFALAVAWRVFRIRSSKLKYST